MRKTVNLRNWQVSYTLGPVASGKVSCIDAVIVVDVITVVIPNETRAGAACASIQNDIQEIITSRRLGTKTVRT